MGKLRLDFRKLQCVRIQTEIDQSTLRSECLLDVGEVCAVISLRICNHIEHPCGYGVWNGNEAAMDFVKYGQIRMIEGDVILFFSDGLENEVMDHKNDDLVRMKLYDLFPEVGIEDSDDRTILRLFIEP